MYIYIYTYVYMGLPNIRGTLVGDPIIRTIVKWGVMFGSLICKLPHAYIYIYMYMHVYMHARFSVASTLLSP